MWLISLLPKQIKRHVGHRPGLTRIVDSLGWLIIDKAIRMVGGLIVGVWVARYLGPEQFGIFNYASAFVVLFTAFATLGLNGIVVRDLVNESDSESVLLGTAFVLQVIGSSIALVMMTSLIGLFRENDSLVLWLVVIMGAGMIIKSADVVRYWFEAKVLSRYFVWCDNSAFLVASAAKVILIIKSASLIAFAWVAFFEIVLTSMLIVLSYIRVRSVKRLWEFDWNIAKRLLLDSWPLVLSGLTVTIYMKIDQIMLGQISGDSEVGIFSAATRISEIGYFIPMMISATVYPSIIAIRKSNPEVYRNRFISLFRMMILMSLVIAVPLALFSSQIINLLFGRSYSAASDVLSVHAWSMIFVFIGVAGSKWYLSENLQLNTLYRTLSAVFVNIFLNILLIPDYGAFGAAWATLASQMMAGFIFNGIGKKTRELFIMQYEAFASLFNFKEFRR